MSTTPPTKAPPESSMKLSISATRATQLSSALSSAQSRIQTASSSLLQPCTTLPRLVAVSKLKPLTDVLALASPPTRHRHFGENYMQELLEKSRLLADHRKANADAGVVDVRWHFIGGLQSNKCQQLARDVEGLWAVESVDSVKKARLLDKGYGEREGKSGPEDDAERERLRVFVQVNTSGEESKSGVDPEGQEVLDLCQFIRGECGNLQLQGLMTIGAIARSKATGEGGENEDFKCLRETRRRVARELGVEDGALELSMGMSEDFEGAIAMGSDEVRVGSTIFGKRPPKGEAKVLEATEGTARR